MATEYKLSYTASEINSKLGKIDGLATDMATKANKSAIPTKTSQLTNDSGYITSEHTHVFWATYGETSIDEIYSAYQNGKDVRMLYEGNVLPLRYCYESRAKFAAIVSGLTAYYVDYDCGWSATMHSLISTNYINRTTKVNASDTNYTTLMARGTSLNSAETTPAVNGAIAWTYE